MTAELRVPSAAKRPANADHFVHFYEEDDVLAAEVARFLRNGMGNGGAAILISRPKHAEQIFREWRQSRFDATDALGRGQLIVLDAAETLERFVVDGKVDAARFDEVIGGVVRSALARFDHLVAFGEMVSLL